MTNETELPDGLQLKEICKALGWQGGTIHQAIGEIKMFRSEYAQRLTLQHHACDQAKRITELEAERDELRELRAEIEGQEPVAQVEVSVQHLRSIVVRSIPGAEIPAAGVQLYARPVPKIPADPGMLIAGMGSSSTQYVMGWNDCRATVLGPLRGDAVAIPDGWKLVKVKAAEFDSLMYWMERCESKGHLERCSDLLEPWAAFEYAGIPEAA